jgi:hypothetical protein
MAKTKKKLKIVEADLTAEDCWGKMKHKGGNRFEIRIDPAHRTERSRLNTVVHEALHCGDMELPEAKVRHLTAVVVEALWREGYRRVRMH